MDAPATPHQNQIPTKKSIGDMSEHSAPLARSQAAGARVEPDANPNLRPAAQDPHAAAWLPASGSGNGNGNGMPLLRVRRHESTPAGGDGAMGPPAAAALAAAAPPFVTSASDGALPRARRGTYDESDAPTTDDEYQVLSARAADGEYPARAAARGWAAASASGGAAAAAGPVTSAT